MGGLGRRQRRVGRRGSDDARLAFEEPENLGHGVAQPVEEQDVVLGDLAPPLAFDQVGEELSRGLDALGVRVGVTGVLSDERRRGCSFIHGGKPRLSGWGHRCSPGDLEGRRPPVLRATATISRIS